MAGTGNFYDGADRLVGMTHAEQQQSLNHFPSPPANPSVTLPDPAQNRQLLADYLWFFDAAGQMTSFFGPDGTSNYNYDASSQLTAADHNQTDEAYAWDGNGNRTNGGFTTVPGNRLLSDGTFNYQYDAEGNRTKRTNIATGETTDYEWDHRNRLTGLIFKDAQGNITKEAHYRYDVNNRRIEKVVDLDGAGSGVATVEGFVYDGAHSVLVFNDAGSLTSRYLFGPEVNQVLAEERIDGNPSVQNNLVIWAFGDHLGTVRDTLASSGRELNHISYDTFGRITNETNAVMGFFRYAHTGMELDRESGMYYQKERYRDTFTLTWINPDPIGFADGPNNYIYVRNNPTNATDPSGLAEPDEFQMESREFRALIAEWKIMELKRKRERLILNPKRWFGDSHNPMSDEELQLRYLSSWLRNPDYVEGPDETWVLTPEAKVRRAERSAQALANRYAAFERFRIKEERGELTLDDSRARTILIEGSDPALKTLPPDEDPIVMLAMVAPGRLQIKCPRPVPRVAPVRTLPEELQAFRQTLPEGQGMAGVARSDLPGLEGRTFRGASPRGGGPMEPGGTITSPNPNPLFRSHAEQDLANQIDTAIHGARLTSEQMVGKTVNMHIEERVCNICRQGLRGTGVPPGVLKQLSDKHPNVTFNVTNQATNEVLRFRGGKFVD